MIMIMIMKTSRLLLLLSILSSSLNDVVVQGRRRLPHEVLLPMDVQHQMRDLTLGVNVNVPKPKSPDDHLVTDLPLMDQAKFPTDYLSNHWAGLLPASGDGDKYLFYWLFGPPADAIDNPNVPLLIWLNGGPACSSMDGLWLENGPLRLVENHDTHQWTIEPAPYSWHLAPAYVVYIDQPVGTGLSFTTSGKYPKNDVEVNIDFYYFLQEFLALHSDKFVSDKKVNRQVFFSGESHAGHYIPSMMNYIRQQNNALRKGNMEIPLGGAAIGNGWTDPRYQYSAHEAGYGFGLIGRAQERYLRHKEEQCQADLASGNYVSHTCFSLLDYVVDNSQGKNSQYKVSQYDQRKVEIKNKARDFPPGHKDVERYLAGSHGGDMQSGLPNDNGKMVSYHDVLQAIHATSSTEARQTYMECTDPPYNALKHQDGLGVVPDVVDLLNHNIRLLFFNGVHDLVCNHVGNEVWLEFMTDYQHSEDYQSSPRYGWMAPSTQQLAGYMKQDSQALLLFLKVLDSGHMVPMDVPNVALDMMHTLLYMPPVGTNSTISTDGSSNTGFFQTYEQQVKADPVGSSSDGQQQCPICPSSSSSNNNNNNNNKNNNNVDCPSCPECPFIENNNDDDDGNSSSSSSQTTTATSGSFLAVSGWIVLGVISTMCFGWCYQKASYRHRRAMDPKRNDDNAPIIELPFRTKTTLPAGLGGNFRDEPPSVDEDDDEEEDDEVEAEYGGNGY